VKSFLLIFNVVPGINTVEMMRDFLNTRSEIKYWYTGFTNGVILVSDQSATTLSKPIHERFPGLWFLMVEIRDSYTTTNGYGPKLMWEVINNPDSKV